jgi:hypothetical protein
MPRHSYRNLVTLVSNRLRVNEILTNLYACNEVLHAKFNERARKCMQILYKLLSKIELK